MEGLLDGRVDSACLLQSELLLSPSLAPSRKRLYTSAFYT